MAVLSKGTTFANGDQVTATKLNNLVDNATFASSAVDNTSHNRFLAVLLS